MLEAASPTGWIFGPDRWPFFLSLLRLESDSFIKMGRERGYLGLVGSGEWCRCGFVPSALGIERGQRPQRCHLIVWLSLSCP